MLDITLIGDAHGQWTTLNKILEQNNLSNQIIQLGDLGLGFHENDPKRTFPANFKFIRGNHDDPAICAKNPHYLGDFGHFEEGSIRFFFMSGADSIDKNYRIEGESWWPNEQLSMEELQQAIDLYARVKPDIVLTHDAPLFLYNQLTNGSFAANGKVGNRTARALEFMFEQWMPTRWYFGHHHKCMAIKVKKTTFRCVDILEQVPVL